MLKLQKDNLEVVRKELPNEQVMECAGLCFCFFQLY